jgi:transposase
MRDFELTPFQLQELHAMRRAAKLEKNVNLVFKIHAVILLGSGWSLDEVVEALFLDDETLRSYAEKYKCGGLVELAETNYKGSVSKLTSEQLSQLCTELDCQVYLTTKQVCAYVWAMFGVEYTESGMADLLKRLGYVYKKPKLVPGNPNKEAQEAFVKFYLDFMNKKKDDEVAFFMDAMHPTHNAQAAYGWFKKGMIKELQTNTGRDRLNIHGAMNAETHETTTIITEDSIDSDTTINLLKTLETLYYWATAIYVILDNAKYHFSAAVIEYLKTSKIKLVFLPAYSPELNLIERLWRFFKKTVLYNQYYPKFSEFKNACINFFKKQDKYLDQIHDIIADGLEAYDTG